MMDESLLTPSEPITVILSKMGWIRAAKGYEIDPKGLNYKQGDDYQASVRGRSNQMVVLLDDTGRAYSTIAHTLPSARGQGEPVTGRFSPPSQAKFISIMMGDDKKYFLASNFGYGFIGSVKNFISKAKGGKAILTIPKGAKILPPVKIFDIETDKLAVVTSRGYLLLVNVKEIPQMQRGKGNKLINIPPARLKSGDEKVVAIISIPNNTTLVIHAGKRYKILKPIEFKEYQSERGKRGKLLPQTYHNVTGLEIRD